MSENSSLTYLEKKKAFALWRMGFRRRAIAGLQERGKIMADKWYEGFFAEFLRELGLEWWFHRKGRTPAGGATTAAPATAQGPKGLLDWVHSLSAKYRRGLEGLSAEDLEALLKMKQEEREAALIARFGLPPSLLESLRETAEKTKEKLGRLEQKIQSSPETRAQIDKANEHLNRWARWLGRRS